MKIKMEAKLKVNNETKNIMNLLTSFITAANYEIKAETTSEHGVYDYTCTRKIKNTQKNKEIVYDGVFLEAWNKYPKRAGNNSKIEAFKSFSARLKSGVKPQEITSGVIRYAAFIRATEKENTEFVMMASTFFGPSRGFENDWILPAINKYTVKLPANNDDLAKFASDHDMPQAAKGETYAEYRCRLQSKIDLINNN